MSRLQEVLSRAMQREWVKDVPGLLPHIAAALEHAGGFRHIPKSDISRDDKGEKSAQRGLARCCESTLDKVGEHHPVSVHLQVKLY